MLLLNFEGREAKDLSKGRYDETFAGEDELRVANHFVPLFQGLICMCLYFTQRNSYKILICICL